MTDLAALFIEEGIEKEKYEVAKKALKEGATIDFVQKITNLDANTIKELEKEIIEK